MKSIKYTVPIIDFSLYILNYTLFIGYCLLLRSITSNPQAISFTTKDKLYVWHKEPKKAEEKKTSDETAVPYVPKLSDSKLKEDKDLQQQMPEEPLNYEELLKENEIELNTSEYQERDIVRLLVQNSEEMYNEGQTVAAYVLNEIETNELKFSNEVYQHIIAACKQRMEDNEPLNQDFFINHEDQRISSLASL